MAPATMKPTLTFLTALLLAQLTPSSANSSPMMCISRSKRIVSSLCDTFGGLAVPSTCISLLIILDEVFCRHRVVNQRLVSLRSYF